MNELIKKLARQTRSELLGMDSSTDRWKEKFVELLLRECFTKLKNIYPPDDSIPVEEAIVWLKEQFEMKD